jgi:hypothetical protein
MTMIWIALGTLKNCVSNILRVCWHMLAAFVSVIDPHTWTVNVLWFQKKEPRYTCLIEAKASHSHRMWAVVSSCAPHLLHNGLSDSPIRWRCLLRVLCPVWRPVIALECVLLKDRNLTASRQVPKINSGACLWVLPRSLHHTQCWLTSQHLILLLISCREMLMLITNNSCGQNYITVELCSEWKLCCSWICFSIPYFLAYKTHRPIRSTLIFSFEILEKIMNVF